MKKIIVPTDFSQASDNAAFYAAEIAERINASLTLLHVIPMPVTAPEGMLPPDNYEEALEETDKSLEKLKEKIESHTGYKLNITCATSTQSFLDELKDMNDREDIFAVVMGTSGTGAAEAFFLGSYSRTAAKHLTRPLIMVPPGYQYKGINKIGLACDMKNVLETVPFQNIKDIFEHFNAGLEILYVSSPSEKMYPEALSEMKFMQNSLAKLHPEIKIETSDDIRKGMDTFVQKSGIDLLLLMPKERGFFENIFHASITNKMVLHPKVPLMILH